MKKIILLVSAFLICFVSQALAQGMIKGTVTEKENGTKLEGVNVFINEIQRGAVTNSEGEYKIENLPSSKYEVQFSYVGYKSEIKTINLDDSEILLNIELIPTNINIGNVLVLGNSVRSQENIPYKIETLSRKKLNTDGFINTANSLSLLPGVSVVTKGSGITKPVIRGLTGYRVAPVINGLRVDNQQWQEEHDFGLYVVGAERVEVIEGPASLLYGSQALGGVIKIENEKNAPVHSIVGNYNLKLFSNTLGASTELGLKGSEEKLSWQVHLNGQSHADYLAGGEQKVPNTRFASFGAAGMLSYNSSWGVSTLDYNFTHQIQGIIEAKDLNNPKDLEEEHFERKFEGPHHIVDYHIIALRNIFLLNESTLKVNVGFQSNTREEAEGDEEETEESKMNELDVALHTFSLDAQWIKPIGSSTALTLGTQVNFQGNENEGGRILIPNAETKEVSGFAYLKQNFGIVKLDAGIRYDAKNIETDEMGVKDSSNYFEKLSENYGTLNGAIGAAVKANENLTFKVNLATGYRAPSLAELTSNGVHEGTTRYEIGDASLKSERSLQTDIGINYQTQNILLNLSLFYNKINNFIFLQRTSALIDFNQVYRFVQSDADLKGGEFSAEFNLLDWLNFNESYSTVIGERENSKYLPLMPADKIITSLNFHWNELSSLKNFYCTLSLRSYLKQDRTAEEETTTPAYSLVDISLGSTVNLFDLDIALSLNATNLLDKKYVDHLSLLKPLEILDMGRNISLAVNVPFIVK